MNKLVMVLVLMTIGIMPVHAATKSHKKAAEKLLLASGLDTSMDRMIRQLVDLQIKQKPAMLPYRNIMLNFFDKYLSYKNVKNDFINIYTSEFTEKELKKITAFYGSPLGKKTISKMPQMMNKGAKIGMGKAQANMMDLRAEIQKEARKISEENAVPAGTKKP